MNMKLKAASIVAGMVAVSFFAAAGCKWITETFTTEQIVQGIGMLSIAALLYMMYTLILTRLEYDSKVEELGKKYSK
jgi:hypothetical protein